MIVETVTSGSLIVALSIAFAAGIVAFLSPCVLPLAPGYVSYVTGLTGAELADPTGRRGRVLLGSLLFVLGFSIVFVSYGVAFGSIGSVLLQYQEPINRVLGVIVIVMGLVFLGVIPGMQREWRLQRGLGKWPHTDDQPNGQWFVVRCDLWPECFAGEDRQWLIGVDGYQHVFWWYHR